MLPVRRVVDVVVAHRVLKLPRKSIARRIALIEVLSFMRASRFPAIFDKLSVQGTFCPFGSYLSTEAKMTSGLFGRSFLRRLQARDLPLADWTGGGRTISPMALLS